MISKYVNSLKIAAMIVTIPTIIARISGAGCVAWMVITRNIPRRTSTGIQILSAVDLALI